MLSTSPSNDSQKQTGAKHQQVYAPIDRCCTVCATGRFLPTCSTITTTASTAISRQGSTISHQSNSKRRKKHSNHGAAKPLIPLTHTKPLLRANSKARKKLDRFEKERQWWAQNENPHDNPEEQEEEKKELENDDEENVGTVALLHPEELTLGKALGEGGSCIVHEVTDLHLILNDDIVKTEQQKTLRNNLLGSFSDNKHPEGRYVIKKLSPKFELGNGIIQVDPLYIEAVAADLILEVRILQALGNRHPNIISLHGASVAEEEMPLLLLSKCTESLQQRIMKWRASVRKYKEQLESPSLWSLLVKATESGANTAGGPPPRPAVKLRKLLWERLRVVRDVGLAVEMLHSRGIVYRDLKVSNIGFDAAGIVKIFDFGLARFLPRAETEEKRRKQREHKQKEEQAARESPKLENEDDAKSSEQTDTPSKEAARRQDSDSTPSRTHWHERQNADSGTIADWRKSLELDGDGAAKHTHFHERQNADPGTIADWQKTLEINGSGSSTATAPDDDQVFAMSCVGTEFTMAPEVTRGHSYNQKADVYSYGVLMWQLLALLTPSYRPDAIDKNGNPISFPLFDLSMCPCWPKKTQEVLTGLLNEDPVARPSMQQSIPQLTSQLETLERAFAPQDEHAQRHQRQRQDSSSLLRSLFHQRQPPQRKRQDSGQLRSAFNL